MAERSQLNLVATLSTVKGYHRFLKLCERKYILISNKYKIGVIHRRKSFGRCGHSVQPPISHLLIDFEITVPK
jgi:hypothetical protein